MDYPWTVLRVGRSQDEGGANAPGPWVVAWHIGTGYPVLVLSERLLQHVARNTDGIIGFRMDAQSEPPYLFKSWNSAVTMKNDLRQRFDKAAWSIPVIRALTLEELDRWKLEVELLRIASEAENGG